MVRRSSWTLGQEMFQTYSTVMRWLLQRIPFMTHFAVVLLGLLGPIVCPQLCAFVLVGTHIVFVLCQSRTAYGIFRCWRGVKEFSNTDWSAEWERETARLPAQDVLHYRAVQHCIILPAYKEDVTTLKETLDILASHPLASSNYHVCLGMEAREAGGVVKAQNIVNSYRSRRAFRDICFSLHPGNIVGEAAGKSSNVNWAARFLANRIPERLHDKSIITVMDADTAFAADFFLASSVKFSLAPPEERARMMFVPPIVFDRNCHDVPIFTRATDIFWSCAGIGGIYPSSQCKIPTSAYAVSMHLADFCGFWDGGPEAIGEDLHFYCKAIFETKGNIKSVTIYSPASQLNVVGSPAKGPIANYINDMKARWTQACRHLWGSLDWGYCWHRTLTGSFGQSSQSTAAYMALGDVDHDDCGPPLPYEEDEDEEKALKTINVAAALLPPGHDLRVPSPSDSVSTACSTNTEETTKVSHVDLPTYAPSPLHPSQVRFESDLSADEGSEDPRESLRGIDGPIVDDSAKPLRRWFRIVVLLTRLYEAHLMVAHVFLIMFVLTLLPAVIHRNGTVSMFDSYNRQCTWAICKHALQVTPFAATADIPADTAPGMQPFWMMPDLLLCSMQLARTLGAMGIAATVAMCLIHDLYHTEACTRRWKRSEAALAAWKANGSVGDMPKGYLGIRAHQKAERRWPQALLDYSAIPAGLLYGILPLLYAQLHHLTTNKMTYVVSAKGKNVVIPVTEETLRQSIDLATASSAHAGSAAARSSLHLARSRVGMNNNASVARISTELTRQNHTGAWPMHRTRSGSSAPRAKTKQSVDFAAGEEALPMYELSSSTPSRR